MHRCMIIHYGPLFMDYDLYTLIIDFDNSISKIRNQKRPYVQYVILRSIDDVVDLRPSSTPDTSPFIETNQELIFQTNDQAGHDHQTTIETEPVYLRNQY